jgi:hypothetical protein
MGSITMLIKIDTIAKIVAETDGSKHGSGCYIATFAPQQAAANTGAATVAA